MYTKVDCNLDYSPLFAMKVLSMQPEKWLLADIFLIVLDI